MTCYWGNEARMYWTAASEARHAIRANGPLDPEVPYLIDELTTYERFTNWARLRRRLQDTVSDLSLMVDPPAASTEVSG